ncbi:MAG: ABC transporter permease [Bryobacteraceae bacterium]
MTLSRAWDIVRLRLRSLFHSGAVDRDLEKELRFHIDQQVEENLRLGMSAGDARTAAIRKIGGLLTVGEECREMRRTDHIENFWRDLRYAIRTLVKSPGFALVMILTLGLSIGANSAIFSVIDGVLLRPLPYPDADRLVRIFFHSSSFPKFPLNPWDLRDFRARNRSFESLAGYTRADLQLSGSGQPERFAGFQVTAGFFHVLGVRPARGREFTSRDELPGNGRLVILSDRLWRSKFEADPQIIGRKITLDSQPFTVAGVMPPGAEHPGNGYHGLAHGQTVDLWWPFTFQGNPANRGSHFVEAIARLKPGIAPAESQAELNSLIAQLAHEHPNALDGWQARVVPLFQEIVGSSRRLLLVLLGAVGLVLLIACANAANLLLARATARQREVAVRAALGAGYSRLVRQMLTESLLIAILGGCLGALLAAGGVRVLVSLLPAGFPRAETIHLNSTVFGFTLLVALLTGILFGLAPALQAARVDLQQSLRDGGRGATGGARHLRLRNILVVAEVSLACILLAGAGLMLRSFVNLLRMDPGFRPEHVLTAGISLPDASYKPVEMIRFYDRLLSNLGTVAGIRAAGIGTDLPWTGYDDNIGGLTIEGQKPPPGQEFHGRYHVASPDYFRALGIPLVEGRFFNNGDSMKGHPVMIVNQAMARRCWPNGSAIGGRIAFDDHPKESDWMTVVGVVGDVKDKPESKEAENAFWWPLLQSPTRVNSMSLVLRGTSDPASLVNVLRNAVRQMDPTLAVADVRLMDQIADASISMPRFALFLVTLFAGLALTLAAIGMYGVISYSVNQRTHEFGLRVALGAKPWDVERLVLRQGMKLALLGIAIGVAGALALGRILWSLLYNVGGADPLTFVSVSIAAFVIAALACYLPARRATSADPMAALRTE